MQKLYRKHGAFVFIAIQSLLYLWFLSLDLFNTGLQLSALIKYTMIILCFCYALLYRAVNNRSIVFYLRGALLFTVIADLFLLILDYYLLGVLSFLIAQQLYGLKLDYEIKQRNHGCIKRFSFQLISTALLSMFLRWMGVATDYLLSITILYFISLVTNVIRAIYLAVSRKQRPGQSLFATGMILFLLCDINVGFYNLSYYLTLPTNINDLLYSTSQLLMWTFYAPSQVLIALSIQQNQQK